MIVPDLNAGAGHVPSTVSRLLIVGNVLDVLALLEEAHLEVLNLGLKLLDGHLMLSFEHNVFGFLGSFFLFRCCWGIFSVLEEG